jgi:hypothetical protein
MRSIGIGQFRNLDAQAHKGATPEQLSKRSALMRPEQTGSCGYAIRADIRAAELLFAPGCGLICGEKYRCVFLISKIFHS